jgi:hypothetical protein
MISITSVGQDPTVTYRPLSFFCVELFSQTFSLEEISINAFSTNDFGRFIYEVLVKKIII